MSEQTPSATIEAPERAGRSRLALLVVATLVLVALSILFLDTPIARAMPEWLNTSETVEVLETLAYHLGDWTLAPAVLAIVLILAGERWRRFLLSFVVAYAVRTVGVESLKWLTGRPRPRQMDGATTFYGPSAKFHAFPSGHAAFAFMFATLLSAYWPRWRVLWYVLAVYVSLSRMVSDAHFLSDIIMGGLIGVLAAVWMLRRWPPQPPADQETVGEE